MILIPATSSRIWGPKPLRRRSWGVRMALVTATIAFFAFTVPTGEADPLILPDSSTSRPTSNHEILGTKHVCRMCQPRSSRRT
ncbi:hypothetical protein LY76DRAFT_590403 [Colletotrichum caudatum]|nr:hypothetical protein LY76DRAFT_590403 [Colletotrichum caudatum]